MGSAGGAGSSQGYARIGIDRRHSREPRIQCHRMFVSTNGLRGLLPPVEAVAADYARVEEINRRRLARRKTAYTELPPGANLKLVGNLSPCSALLWMENMVSLIWVRELSITSRE